MHTLQKAVAVLAFMLMAGGLLPARAQCNRCAPTTIAPTCGSCAPAYSPCAPTCEPNPCSTCAPCAPCPNVVHVSLTDCQIGTDVSSIPVGSVRFVITNNGLNPHSFALNGPCFNQGLSCPVQPGQTVTVNYCGLQPGAYRIIDPTGCGCAAMRAALVVSECPWTPKGGCGCPWHVRVSLTDCGLMMSQFTAPRGTVIFDIVNNGHHRHTFNIDGPGLTAALPYTLRPGDSFIYTIEDMRRGSYRVYDPLLSTPCNGTPITGFVIGPTPPISMRCGPMPCAPCGACEQPAPCGTCGEAYPQPTCPSCGE